MKQKILLFSICISVIFSNCKNEENNDEPKKPKSTVKNLSYSIIKSYPHDSSSYIEGLLFYKGGLYESSGEYEGKSKLMKVDLETGKRTKEITLDGKYFGEGITILNDTVYQLTYREKKGFAYDVNTFKIIKEFPINIEGWGLTNDSTNLIAGDGSSNLYYYKPSDFSLIKKLSVTENGELVNNINELEFINGYIYANRYTHGEIIKIDPSTGNVVAKINLDDMVSMIKNKYPYLDINDEVLNGIAYNPETNKIYVTGKHWPELFEIQFEH